jgi:Fic family protein
MREITNIEQALAFVEENIKPDEPITRIFLSELHKILMRELALPPESEGSINPGEYRRVPVTIKNALHREPKYDLLVTALAHHRFAWIHPYDNGNGRVVRMLTYALLIRQGFRVHASGRILNPTAIFCMDRSRYYDMLARADAGDKEGALAWSEYVLNGLLNEIHKVDKLAERDFVQNKILLPALRFALERRLITEKEFAILCAVIENAKMEVKSADLEKAIGSGSPVQRARIIGKLKERDMLNSLTTGGRIYTIKFTNNFLLRGIIDALEKQNFIPDTLNKN